MGLFFTGKTGRVFDLCVAARISFKDGKGRFATNTNTVTAETQRRVVFSESSRIIFENAEGCCATNTNLTGKRRRIWLGVWNCGCELRVKGCGFL